MMKKLILLCVGIWIFASCGLDRKAISSLLFLQYKNQTDQNISVQIFPISNYYGYDTLWFTLTPGENYTSDYYSSYEFTNGPGVFDTFQPGIYSVFNVDSAHVVFSDSLMVIYYARGIPQDSVLSDAIYYMEPRNIFNFDNYTIEKINETDFKATYIFTESDLIYADSIHE